MRGGDTAAVTHPPCYLPPDPPPLPHPLSLDPSPRGPPSPLIPSPSLLVPNDGSLTALPLQVGQKGEVVGVDIRPDCVQLSKRNDNHLREESAE